MGLVRYQGLEQRLTAISPIPPKRGETAETARGAYPIERCLKPSGKQGPSGKANPVQGR
jgi:hypothetical protein